MKFVAWTTALAVATMTLVPVANAADARLSDCISMAREVSTALGAAQPGKKTDEARDHAAAGRNYCASQMYAKGVAQYSKALQLLGKG